MTGSGAPRAARARHRVAGGLIEWALVTVSGIILTTWFTYPLVFRMDRLGRTDSADGQFSIWNVAWVARTVVADPLQLFDANIFYPHRGALAFSEANLGAGLLAVPAYWVTRNAFTAHNFSVVVAFTLSVVASYYLVRYVTNSRGAAAVSCVLYAFCPFVFARTAHIQLQMVFPLPLCLLAMHRFVDAQTAGRTVLLGVALAVQAAFSAYFAVLAGLLVALGVVYYGAIGGRWRRRRYWVASTVAAGVALLLVLPLFLPYVRLQRTTGFSRALIESYDFSADWRAYLASNARFHTWMLPLLKKWNEVLFPGMLATGLGLAGLWVGLRSRDPDTDQRTRAHALYYALVGGFALWASVGPAAGLYTFLFHTIPVFSWLRAPARFGIGVTLALVVFAGIAVARCLRRQPQLRSISLAALLVLGALVDLHLPSLPYQEVEPVPAVYGALRNQPPGAVVDFPFFQRHIFRYHTLYMVNSTVHWRPLVNGYSDYFPPDFRETAGILALFPDAEGLALLRERGVRYAIVHLNRYPPADRAAVLQRLDQHRASLKPLALMKDTLLYEIDGAVSLQGTP